MPTQAKEAVSSVALLCQLGTGQRYYDSMTAILTDPLLV